MRGVAVLQGRLGRAIEGPESPGFFNFVRWLFEPIRSATPPHAPSREEARGILAALQELEERRSVPDKPSTPLAEASVLGSEGEDQAKALIAVLEALRTELGLGAREAFDWMGGQQLSSFRGQTPLQMIERGHGAAVVYYIRSISGGFQG